MTNNIANSLDGGTFIVLDFSGDDLDPAPLISVIPLRPVRPRKKKQPLGRSRGGKVPIAKTGYCGFTTLGRGLPSDGDAHLKCLLNIIEDQLAAIRSMMAEQSLAWQATFFEDESAGQSFAALSPDLSGRAARLNLPLVPKLEEVVTIVADPDDNVP